MSAVEYETGSDDADRRDTAVRVVRVWDLPLRIFHWALVIAVGAAYVTGEFGGADWVRWHGRIGSIVLGLLVFRFIWGFIGTQHSRFATFLPTRARLIAYIEGQWQGVGHNPLGAFSVILLLALITAQVVTGLFSNDDIAFGGPLSNWIGRSASERLTSWHAAIFDVLTIFILLHILAIIFYLLVRRTNLVPAMITGNKSAPIAEQVSTVKHLTWRFVAAALIAASVSWSVFQGGSSVQAEAVAPPGATADW